MRRQEIGTAVVVLLVAIFGVVDAVVELVCDSIVVGVGRRARALDPWPARA